MRIDISTVYCAAKVKIISTKFRNRTCLKGIRKIVMEEATQCPPLTLSANIGMCTSHTFTYTIPNIIITHTNILEVVLVNFTSW